MNPAKVAGLVLIVGGALALAYGGFSYTKDTHEGHIGSLDLTLKDREHVNVPAWAGIAAIVIGAGVLLVPARKI